MSGRVALLLSLVALACGSWSHRPPHPWCSKDKHCNPDLREKCVDGSCQNCTSDSDCADKGELLECREFRCQERDALDDGGGYTDCASVDDCGGGLVCIEAHCDHCTTDAQCESGFCEPQTGRCESVRG